MAKQEIRNAIKPVSLYRSDSSFTRSYQPSVQSQKPDLSRRKDQPLSSSKAELLINKETLLIHCVFKYEGKEYTEDFEIHKSRDTADLINRVVKWMRTDFKFEGDDSEILIRLNGDLVKSGKSLSEAEIKENAALEVSVLSNEPSVIE